MKKALLVILSILLLASCVSTNTTTYVVAEPVPSYTDWAWLKSIKNVIYVELEANATTGYEWYAVIDGDSIVERDSEYIAPEETGMVGVPGEWDAEFKAVCDGESIITFVYSRPWDPTDIAETIVISVIVEDGVITSVEELI